MPDFNFIADHGDWSEYFRQRSEYVRSLKQEDKEDAPEGNVAIPNYSFGHVEVWGHDILLDELPKAALEIAKMLPNTRARHSRTVHEGNVYKTGKKQGEKRPDKTVDHYAIGHRGRHPLTAIWSDGNLWYAKGFRDGEWVYPANVTELKALIKGGWE